MNYLLYILDIVDAAVRLDYLLFGMTGLCFFLAGRASLHGRKKFTDDNLGVWISENQIIESDLMYKTFTIHQISRLPRDSKTIYDNHYLLFVRFTDEELYKERTLVIHEEAYDLSEIPELPSHATFGFVQEKVNLVREMIIIIEVS